MFNLYQIITGAQGGQALDNLASQFGISREQADAAVRAMVPALSTAFMTKVAQPGGLQEIAGALDDDDHKRAYADPEAAQAPAAQLKSSDILSSIFGSNSIVDQVVQQASKFTGIPAETLRGMLPMIVAIVVGGVSTAMHNQGLGGILGQLAGGLGGLFGQAGGAPGQAGTGGFGGMFGNILGSFLGGGRDTPRQPAEPQSSAPNTSAAGGPELPPMVQAGLDQLSKMFQPGVAPHPAAQPDDLGDQISSILGGKRS